MRCVPPLLLLLLTAASSLAAGWETLAPCRLVTAVYHDGDSFHVSSGGRDKVFRLYAVDTPETSDDFPERVKEQCKHFGVKKSDLLAAAAQAERLTFRLLAKPFTVETRWTDAKGNSRQRRYFAKITLSDGSDLGVRLIEAGLARSYGLREGLAPSYLAQLDRAEQTAKRLRAGIWSGKAVPVEKEPAPAMESSLGNLPADTLDQESQGIFDRLQQEGRTGVE